MTRSRPRRRPRRGPSRGANPEPSRGTDRGQKRGSTRGSTPGTTRGRKHRPTRAIRTDQGVASRSQSGAFVESWWAERWVGALERLITSARLVRGQAYARAGQVLSVAEDAGTVRAKVQGSRRTPYRVTIGLTPLADEAWERVFSELARRPDLAASLLAGEMPRDIDEVFAQAEASLFPTAPDHLRLECSCPDKVTVCKHIVATCYLMGEQLDEDPFLLFRLRGRGQDEVLAGLRRAAGGGADSGAERVDDEGAMATANGAAASTPLEAADFWSAAQPPRIDLPGEHPDLSLLRRLGPFSALDDDLVAHLGPTYRAVAALAEAAFEAADTEPASDDDSGGA